MPPVMIHDSANFLMALANAAARSLVLGCMVAATIGGFQVKNARIKLLLWKGVLLAALAMPLLTFLAPAIQVAVPLPNLQERKAKAADTATDPVLPQTRIPKIPAKKAPHAAKHRELETAAIPAGTWQPVASAPAAPSRQIPWTLLALCTYLAIAFVLLARVFVGMRFGRHLVRAATLINDVRARRMLSMTSRAAALRAEPLLAESEMICAGDAGGSCPGDSASHGLARMG
jgi:hypothetical protein